jgi:uncharacterized membrane protein YfcA
MAVILEILAVMFLASTFRTAFGFGEALISVPLLALALPVKVAAPVAVFASIAVALFVVARDWRHIHFRSAGWLLLSTVAGIPVGLWLLKAVPEAATKILLACVILAYSGYSLLHPRRFSLENDRMAWLFGFGAGVFGGSYGMNGPPLAIYGALRGWTPERFRATLQGYFLPASLLGLAGYGAAGLLTGEVGRLALWSLPAIAAGIFAGRQLSRRLSAQRFASALHGGLIFVALLLLFQGARLAGLAPF